MTTQRSAVSALTAVFMTLLAPLPSLAQDPWNCHECTTDGCSPGYDYIFADWEGVYKWEHGSYCSSSGCPAESCGNGTDLLTAVEAATLLENALQGMNLATVRSLLATSSHVRVNHRRFAIQVSGCTGNRVIAHFPLRLDMVLALGADVLGAAPFTGLRGPFAHAR